MQVPFFTHLRELERHGSVLMHAVEDCVHSSRLILGERVAALEQALAEQFCGVGAVGMASGTDALTLALRALSVGGGEVITVSNTCTPTVAAIRDAGATPVFVDVCEDTLQMNVDLLEQAITPQTKCIVPVHLFGNAVDMVRLMEIADAHQIPVVEDCAQSYGTMVHDAPTGSFGAISCFSFYPTKNLGGWGDGGLCVCREEQHVAALRALHQYGWDDASVAQSEGVNSRLDELQAAVLLAKRSFIEEDLARRRAIAAQYDEALQHASAEPVATTPGATHSYHLYVLRTPDRARAQARLREAGIGTAVHYAVPVHRMPAYAFLGYEPGSLPVTEQAADQILSLPIFPTLTDEEVSYVGEVLKSL